MKISMSSAEFIKNGDLYNLLFGEDQIKYTKTEYGISIDSKIFFKSAIKSNPISFADINKLRTWDSYKKEIEAMFVSSVTDLKKDKLGNEWLTVCGTGYCYLYNLGREL